MKANAVRAFFRRIEPVEEASVPSDAKPIPPVLSIFLRLNLPLTAVARVLGVTLGCVSQWRSHLRPIPYERKIEMVALLDLIRMRLFSLARQMDDPLTKSYIKRQAIEIAEFLADEIDRSTRRCGGAEKFTDDVIHAIDRRRTDVENKAIERILSRLEKIVAPMWKANDERRAQKGKGH
jgi:hypothetical protein